MPHLSLQALRRGQAVGGGVREMAAGDLEGKGKARAAPEVSCRLLTGPVCQQGCAYPIFMCGAMASKPGMC